MVNGDRRTRRRGPWGAAGVALWAIAAGCVFPRGDGPSVTQEPASTPSLAAAAAPEGTATTPLQLAVVDEDGDGFTGPDDRCPHEPGIEPDGCPLRDSDGDGLLDPDDATCPEQCETYNGYQDGDGCPDEAPADLVALAGPIEGLYFEFNKYNIDRRSFVVLDALVDTLARYPDIKVEIEGHRDSVGRRYSRVRLSQRRADSVRRYFIEKGIAADRLEARGYGEDRPIASNKTAEGRAKNRRIELRVVVKAPDGADTACTA